MLDTINFSSYAMPSLTNTVTANPKKDVVNDIVVGQLEDQETILS